MKPMFASTVCLLHKISRLGLILALGLLVGAAQASETAAWTGGSGFFTNGANWNTGIAPTNLGDTANITNATAGYTITLYNPTSTVTNNLLVVSNATMIITQAVMTVSNTLATSSNPQNNNLSQGTLTLWSGGHLEIDNGGTLNITASTTNTDIAWNDPNGLVVLNNGGTLYATGQQNCAMCSNAGWTTHITSTAASTTGSVFNYGGNRLLYVGRYVSNSTLIIDNGVAVSNLWTVTLGQNGTNNAILVTNKASLWFTGISGQSLNIGNAVGSVSNSVVVSNAFLYGPQFTIGGYNGANYNNLIITSGSLCSNAGAINIGGVSTNGFGNYFILNNSTLVCNPFVNSSLQIGGGTTNSSNYAAIVNGSTATESAVTIGGSTGSVYNYLLVSNATLKLTNTSTTAINIAGGAPCASVLATS